MRSPFWSLIERYVVLLLTSSASYSQAAPELSQPNFKSRNYLRSKNKGLRDIYGQGSWTQTSASNAGFGWNGVASDSTGQYLVAVSNLGGIYTNSNYGSGSWTLTSAPSSGEIWQGVTSSNNGKYLAAVINNGGIYINANYGSGSWTETSAPNEAWYAIAGDSSGKYLAAAIWGGGIYRNNNYGLGSWTLTLAPSECGMVNNEFVCHYWNGIATGQRWGGDGCRRVDRGCRGGRSLAKIV